MLFVLCINIKINKPFEFDNQKVYFEKEYVLNIPMLPARCYPIRIMMILDNVR